MADLDILMRGTAWNTVGGENAGSQSVAVDDVALGDYVMAAASVDYVPATNPSSVSCPIIPSWTELAYGTDPTSGSSRNMQVRVWLGRVTTAPTDLSSRTVTVTQTATSGQTIVARALYGGSSNAVIARDGTAAAIVDRATPYTHTTITPTGTRDLLVVFYAGIRFTSSGPTLVGPSGMTATGAAVGAYHRSILCTEQRTTNAATGTRDVTNTNVSGTALAGGTGVRFLLRSQGDLDPTGPEPGRGLLAA